MFGPSPRQTSLLVRFAIVALALLAMLKFLPRAAGVETAAAFFVCVSTERDGTATEIDGTHLAVTRTFLPGKRPRGIHVAPDDRTLLVATSGSPRMAPGADRERVRAAPATRSRVPPARRPVAHDRIPARRTLRLDSDGDRLHTAALAVERRGRISCRFLIKA